MIPKEIVYSRRLQDLFLILTGSGQRISDDDFKCRRTRSDVTELVVWFPWLQWSVIIP